MLRQYTPRSSEKAGARPYQSGRTDFYRSALELREMIWKLALPGPRVFNVESSIFRVDTKKHRVDVKKQLLGRTALKTPLVHVCYASRRIVKEAGYVLEFRDEDQPQDPGVWFHPLRDVVKKTWEKALRGPRVNPFAGLE
ncbi:Uu.00g041680.m01.CDS01 [Anthostomella pinea]|uniref:Uu.00g041680.m01.CDS01 n=1 Tax=Anthostomella pinea TaxID=933095 RepID=A0AAI8YE14_9PEZI|nr:Uu.00g041680.m01.CDS01 [Anthostomella pinea]